MKAEKLGKIVRNYRHHKAGKCTVCGRMTLFICLDPESFRNTMICLFCRSASRNRHVAKAILDIVGWKGKSIADLFAIDGVSIYNTATDDCFSRVLGVVSS